MSVWPNCDNRSSVHYSTLYISVRFRSSRSCFKQKHQTFLGSWMFIIPCWMASGFRLVRTLKTFEGGLRCLENCDMHLSPFVDILFTRWLFQIIIKRSIDNKLHFVSPLPHWFVLTIERGLQAEQWGWMESGWITTWSRFLSHCFRSTPLSNPHR